MKFFLIANCIICYIETVGSKETQGSGARSQKEEEYQESREEDGCSGEGQGMGSEVSRAATT